MGVELELQKAVLARLTGDSALMATLTAVTDRQRPVADGGAAAGFPYLHATIFLDEWDTDDTEGFEALIRVHTWSRSGSYAETKSVQGRLYELLHRVTDLTVAGHHLILIRRESSWAETDPDGITIHGVCEYRALLDAA